MCTSPVTELRHEIIVLVKSSLVLLVSVLIVLEIGESIPDHLAIQRWFAEPVKAVVIPTSIFIPNKSGECGCS